MCAIMMDLGNRCGGLFDFCRFSVDLAAIANGFLSVGQLNLPSLKLSQILEQECKNVILLVQAQEF